MKFPNSAAYVFINHTGRPMTQSNVASALTVAFNKCGFSDRVTCTKVVKAAVTQVHSSHPQKRHDVANHMCHRVSTAEKHYRFIEHKTAWIQGPAKIVLTKYMYSWLNIFVANIPSQFVTDGDDDDMVFLTTNGEPMESSQISRALQSVWQKAGLGNKITCTLLRKTAVTNVHQDATEMSANLADLVCHRLETAKKSYGLVNCDKTSVAAAAIDWW